MLASYLLPGSLVGFKVWKITLQTIRWQSWKESGGKSVLPLRGADSSFHKYEYPNARSLTDLLGTAIIIAGRGVMAGTQRGEEHRFIM